MSKKDAYVEKTKAQIDEWNAEIDKLQAVMRKADADAKIKYEKQIHELLGKQKELGHRLGTCQERLSGQLRFAVEVFRQGSEIVLDRRDFTSGL